MVNLASSLAATPSVSFACNAISSHKQAVDQRFPNHVLFFQQRFSRFTYSTRPQNKARRHGRLRSSQPAHTKLRSTFLWHDAPRNFLSSSPSGPVKTSSHRRCRALSALTSESISCEEDTCYLDGDTQKLSFPLWKSLDKTPVTTYEKEHFICRRVQVSGKFMVHVMGLDDGKRGVKVVLTTDVFSQALFHWGVTPRGAASGQWAQPPASMLPQGSWVCQDSSVETPMEAVILSPSEDGAPGKAGSRLEIIMSEEDVPAAINFVIRDEETGAWHNDHGRNFVIPLPEPPAGNKAQQQAQPLAEETEDEQEAAAAAAAAVMEGEGEAETVMMQKEEEPTESNSINGFMKSLAQLFSPDTAADSDAISEEEEEAVAMVEGNVMVDGAEEIITAPAPSSEAEEHLESAVAATAEKREEGPSVWDGTGQLWSEQVYTVYREANLRNRVHVIVEACAPMGVHVRLRTDMDGPVLVHWGVVNNRDGNEFPRNTWMLPPSSVWPEGTHNYKKRAVQTMMQLDPSTGALSLDVDFGQPGSFTGVHFVLKHVSSGKWYNDGGQDYVALLPTADELPLAFASPDEEGLFPAFAGPDASSMADMNMGAGGFWPAETDSAAAIMETEAYKSLPFWTDDNKIEEFWPDVPNTIPVDWEQAKPFWPVEVDPPAGPAGFESTEFASAQAGVAGLAFVDSSGLTAGENGAVDASLKPSEDFSSLGIQEASATAAAVLDLPEAVLLAPPDGSVVVLDLPEAALLAPAMPAVDDPLTVVADPMTIVQPPEHREELAANETMPARQVEEAKSVASPASWRPDGAAAPVSSGTGSGQEVLLQGFNWESHKSRDLYDTIASRAEEIAAWGFTVIWLPPPTESISPEGYMPKDLFCLDSRYGNLDSLKACIEELHSHGISVLGDVVLNHRCAHFQNHNGVWNIFGGRLSWDDRAVVCDDPNFQGRGGKSSGDNFHAAPNIDHSQDFVRNGYIEWLQWLRSEVGYDGWRLDYVRGFWGGFVKEYMQATSPCFAVGEYWDSLSYSYGKMDYNQDSHRQRIIDWMNATGGNCGAFDVTTKGILHTALERCEYWRLTDASGKPPGVLGWWPSRAVTFIENHDTGSTQGHWRFPSGKEMQGYAYILTHPGTPTVFYDHMFSHMSGDISQLLALRKRAGLHCRSVVYIERAEQSLYVARIDDKVLVKIGPGHYCPPSGPRQWNFVTEGPDYKIWEAGQP